MENTNTGANTNEIDLLKILRLLWRRAIIIVLVAVLGAGVGYAYAALMISPVYQARALMYVNNNAISIGSMSMSVSELTAAKSLVSTYTVILKTRNTLEAVIANTGVGYSYETLNGMVSTGAVNDTEIFSITVTSSKPEEAAMLANAIAEVLPDSISSVVEGSSVKVVDRAVVPRSPMSPNRRNFALIGGLLAAVITALIVILIDMFDNIIRSEDDIIQAYDLPVLGTIPNLSAHGDGKYGYGYGYGRKQRSDKQ